MYNNRFILLCLVSIFFVAKSKAQTVAELSTLKAPVSAITVDANVKDWGDSLRYYSFDAGVHYAFTNDKDNLYFAIKLDDPGEVMRALGAGVMIGINPKGKSKPSSSITFPVTTQAATTTKPATPPDGAVTQADRDNLHRQLATNLRGIKVDGLKDVEGDMITNSNTYGIKTAVDYDTNGNLILECAIPFKFLSVDAKSKGEWTFDVKINGLANPPKPSGDKPPVTSSFGGMNGGGGRGGMGGGMGGGRGGRGGRGGQGGQSNTANLDDKTGLSKAVEFAGKFNLAPVQ